MPKVTKARMIILQRLNAERAKTLRVAKTTFFYYPSSRARSKVFNKSAFRGLKFKTAEANDEENDEDEDDENDDEDDDEEENEENEIKSINKPRIMLKIKKIVVKLSKTETKTKVKNKDVKIENVKEISNFKTSVKFKKFKTQFLSIINANNNAIIKNTIYLLKIVIKFKNFSVHENFIMSTFKNINKLNFENLYINIIKKKTKTCKKF